MEGHVVDSSLVVGAGEIVLGLDDGAANQRRPGLLPRFRVLGVFESVLGLQLCKEFRVLNRNQFSVTRLC